MARGRYDEAAEILSAALDLSDRGDEELVDVLYYLGVARRRLGEDAAADELFDRVARVDADFRESLQVLGD
jgi:tetratricopeptide (TPR) repeat protein